MQKDEIEVMKYGIRSKSGTSRLGFESGCFDEPAGLSSSLLLCSKQRSNQVGIISCVLKGQIHDLQTRLYATDMPQMPISVLKGY
jgi:hypothetical protein